jgi:hypothetical protein
MDKTDPTQGAARARSELEAMEDGGRAAPSHGAARRVSASNVSAQEDSDLSVGDLEDWFDKDTTPPPADRFPRAVTTQPVASMIHGFVEDF